jgi:hypothetical protein
MAIQSLLSLLAVALAAGTSPPAAPDRPDVGQISAEQPQPPSAALAASADQIGGADIGAAVPPRETTAPLDLAAAPSLGHTDQVDQPIHGLGATDQLSGRDGAASAPAELSPRGEGHSVSMVVVHGHDRCDPVKGDATQEECADILDYRADQFSRPAPAELSPEEALIESPASTNLASGATAERRLGGPGGAEGTLAGAQAAALAAAGADRSTPAVPLAVISTLNAAAGTITGSSSSTPPAVVTTSGNK